MKGFMKFIREQGVVGLAVGFILGGAIAKVVSSLVADILDPLIGAALGSGAALQKAHVTIGGAKLTYGNFISVLIDFIVIALVVYFGVKALRLDKLDKAPEEEVVT